jgi:hypothetical protein
LGVEDSRLGLGSAQVFAGEDPLRPYRLQAQRAQQGAWVRQQAEERALRDRAEAEERWRLAEELQAAAALGDEIEALQSRERKDRERAALAQNLDLAEERRLRLRAEAEEERRLDQLTQATMATNGAGFGLAAAGDALDGFLPAAREALEAAAHGGSGGDGDGGLDGGAASPLKGRLTYRVEYYRGAPADGGSALSAGLQAQMEAKQEQARLRRAAEEEAERDAGRYRHLGSVRERAVADAKARQREEYLAALAEQAEAQRRRKAEELQASRGAQAVTNDWWSRFGTSDR